MSDWCKRRTTNDEPVQTSDQYKRWTKEKQIYLNFKIFLIKKKHFLLSNGLIKIYPAVYTMLPSKGWDFIQLSLIFIAISGS